jgi:hypothetical protein
MFRTAAHYGLAFVAPNEPSLVTFTLENYRSFSWIILGISILVGVGAFIRWAWKSNRVLAWIALSGLLVYIPISNCPTVPSLVVGPFRCAQAGIAVACLFGIGAASAISSRRYVWTGLLSINWVVGLSVTWWGIHQWLTPFTFFSRVAENDPHFMVGVAFYTYFLDEQGRSKEAVALSESTLTWLFGTQRWPEAIDRQQRAAISPPVFNRLRSNTGIPKMSALGNFIASDAYSLAKAGQRARATLVAKDALLFSPMDPWVNFLYGRLNLATNRSDAIRHWEIALRASPKYAECAILLAHERIVDHRYKEAVALLTMATNIVPDTGGVWLELADAWIGLKEYSAASTAVERAQKARQTPTTAEIEKRIREIQSATLHH